MPSQTKADATIAALAAKGFTTGSLQDRLSAYYKSKFTTPPIPWVDPDQTAFTPIAALTENFETGVNGTDLTTGNSIFDTFTLSTGTAKITTDRPYIGTRSLRIAATASNPIIIANVPSVASAWYGFAFRFSAAPATNDEIAQWYVGATNVVSLRLNTTRTLTFRDNGVARSSSPALTADTWYEIHTKVTINGSCFFNIYNLDTTSFYTSPAQTFSTTTGTISDFRIGSFNSNQMLNFDYDYIRADSTREMRHAYWVQPPDTPGTNTDTSKFSVADMQKSLNLKISDLPSSGVIV